METIDRQFNSVKNRSGSALILVVVLTVLLSLIGAMFMLMARIDEMATRSIESDRQIDAAVNTITSKISDVLVQDVYGNGTSPYRFEQTAYVYDKTNEAWDYPSADSPDPSLGGDPWLACLEPEYIDSAFKFRRITDLYNKMGSTANSLEAKIIADDAETAAGQIADADGDGVSDSRWFEIPNITTDDGKPIFSAVRIVDNGGMINVNTAYRNPELITLPGRWDGSQISHVNLEGITDRDPANRYDAALVQQIRYGSVVSTAGAADFYDYLNDIEYEANVARRLDKPSQRVPGKTSSEAFLPFDIGDELELRNRFFLTTSFRKTGTALRLYQAWPVTFNPQSDPGKGLPYKPGDDINNWYSKVGPDGIGSSNRRHYSTTVSREVLARQYPGSVTFYPASMNATRLNPEQKIGITLPVGFADDTITSDVVRDNFIKRLAMGIYRGLPEDLIIAERFGADYTREQLAWQMALNMVDYQDANSLGETITTAKIGDTTYFGTENLETLKKNTICISKLGYRWIKFGATRGKHYGIEVFNPDDDTAKGTKDLSDYKIIITNSLGRYKGEFDLSGTIKHSGSSDGADDTLAFLFNDSGLDSADTVKELKPHPARFVFVSTPPVRSIDIGDRLIVFNKNLKMPVDCITIPAVFDGTSVMRRRVALPGTHFLLPSVTGIDVWESKILDPTNPIHFGERLGDVIDPEPDGSTPEAELIEPESSPDARVQQLQLAGVQFAETDQPFSNIGEIENVFAVGTRYRHDDNGTQSVKTDDTIKCTTLVNGIVDSLVAITGAGTTGYDPTVDQQGGVDMKTFGRVSLNAPDFAGLLDSLTYFDPSRDGVDLDNIAEGITPTVNGTTDGGDPNMLTDGKFLAADSAWDSTGTVYWTDPSVEIEIDIGSSELVWGAIIQADFNDEYILEYQKGSVWLPLMTVQNNIEPLPLNTSGGMQTRPDVYDDGHWHLFDKPVIARKFRIKAVGTTGASDEFSLSEIQLGVNINLNGYEPYYNNRIAGRININTAPWYVINQLPWMEDSSASEPGALAQAVVAFRDKTATPAGDVDYSAGRGTVTGITGISEEPGFTDIAQLMQVVNQDPALVDFDIRRNIFDGTDATEGDYTPDTAVDDFEERNLLFHRISNLVTVRSDVFTAYILVRIGENGPQRRMIAIFDRSGLKSKDDKPKILAIHPVPDPR